MTDDALLAVLHASAQAVRQALDALDDWGRAGTRPGQYRSDLAADEAAVRVLVDAGLGVVSEESGAHHPERKLIAVVDPVDGSTNASRGLPWFATSLCVLDASGPRVALVVNQGVPADAGATFEATRGGGARDGRGTRLVPSGCTEAAQALVALNGYPPSHLGWKQYRALGAAALDLCAVASGAVDAYVDCTRRTHGPWDYLAGLLICQEAGAVVTDVHGEVLVTREHSARRTPLAAATPELAGELFAARVAFP